MMMNTPPTKRLHVINAALSDVVPSETILREEIAATEIILEALRGAVERRDELLAKRTLKQVETEMDLLNRFTARQRADIVVIASKVATLLPSAEAWATVWTCSRALRVMTRLLNQRTPALREIPELREALDWKPYYALLNTLHGTNFFAEGAVVLDGNAVVPRLAGENPLRYHMENLVKLSKKARYYQADASLAEICTKFEASVVDHPNRFRGEMVEDQGLLLTFYPSLPDADAALRVERWISSWGKIDGCGEWDAAWLTLLGRVAKYNPEKRVEIFEPHLGALFGRFHASLRLPVPSPNGQPQSAQQGGSTVSRRHTKYHALVLRQSASQVKSGKLLISILHVGDTFKRFIHLLASIRTFLHPSNGGGHAERTATFVNALCEAFAKRMGRDSVSDAREGKLEGHIVNDFIASMLPLLQMGLLSKSLTVTNLAQNALQHLCWISPNSVTTTLVPLISSGLDPLNLTHAHQAPAAIKAFTVVLKPLLFSSTNKKARKTLLANLLPVLQNSLPGLDPNDVRKTLVTLMLNFAFLSSVPTLECTGFYDETNEKSPDAFEVFDFGVESGATPPAKATTPNPPAMMEGVAMAAVGEGEEIEGETLKSLNEALSEWSLELLRRLFSLARARGKRAKKGLSAQMDAVADFFFASLTSLLMSRMSVKTRRLAHKMTFDFIFEETLPNANKECLALSKSVASSLLGNTFVSQSPADTSDDLKTYAKLVDNVRSKLKASRGEEKAVLWCLTAMGGLVRFGGPALSKSPNLAVEIDSIAKRYLKHKDADVRKCAAKLIRRLVRGLTDTYPLGVRNEVGMTTWGMAMKWGRLNLDWYRPSLSELDLAARILTPHIDSTMEALERAHLRTSSSSDLNASNAQNTTNGSDVVVVPSPDEVVSLDSDDLEIENGEEEMSEREKAKCRFMLLHQLVRASLTLFSFKRGGPNFFTTGNSLDAKVMTCRIRGEDEDFSSGSTHDFVMEGVEGSAPTAGGAPYSSFTNFPKSEALALRLLRISEVLRSSTDATVLNSMLKSLALLGSGANGPKGAGQGEHMRGFSMWAAWLRDINQSKAHESRMREKARREYLVSSRADAADSPNPEGIVTDMSDWMEATNVMVSHIENQYRKRVLESSFFWARAMRGDEEAEFLYGKIIDEFTVYSTHEFSAVRKKAQALRKGVDMRFPWLAKRRIYELVARLGDANIPPHVFTGIVYLLNNDMYMKWIGHARFDENFASFVRVVGMDTSAVIESFPSHRQEKSTERALSILLRGISSHTPVPTNMRIERNKLILDLAIWGQKESTHWRKKMSALVTIGTLLGDVSQESVSPVLPRETLHFLSSCVLKSDIAPLKSLAIHLCKRLIPIAEVTFNANEPAPFYVSQEFWKECALTLKEDRAAANEEQGGGGGGGGGGGNSGASWSAGVTEMMQLVKYLAPRFAAEFPYFRFELLTPSDFHADKAAIWTTLADVASRRDPSLLDGLFDSTVAKMTEEFESNKDRLVRKTAVAEIVAGALSSKGGERLLTPAFTASLAKLMGEVPNVSNFWCDAMRYVALRNRDAGMRVFEFLLRDLEQLQGASAAATATSDDGEPMTELEMSNSRATASFHHLSNLVKVEGYLTRDLALLLTTFPSPASSFSPLSPASRLLPILTKKFFLHRYKIVREPTAFILASFISIGLVESNSTSETLRHALPALALPATPQSTTPPPNKEAIEAALYYLGWMCTHAEAKYVLRSIVTPLAPAAFLGLTASDVEVANLAKHVMQVLSGTLRGYGDPPAAGDLERALIAKYETSADWTCRRALCSFLAAFHSTHSALLMGTGTGGMIQKTAENLLKDSQAEVREQARVLLSGLLASAPPAVEVLSSARDRYLRLARTQGDAVKKRQGILALSALVQAFPYSVPPFLPSAVVELAKAVNFSNDQIARKALSEFRRTHQDDWVEHKRAFTSEELEQFDNVLTSPDYYA